jgi:hypothetical protein
MRPGLLRRFRSLIGDAPEKQSETPAQLRRSCCATVPKCLRSFAEVNLHSVISAHLETIDNLILKAAAYKKPVQSETHDCKKRPR